jgi:glycosyltransferase involved in cell wall biosynthesis
MKHSNPRIRTRRRILMIVYSLFENDSRVHRYTESLIDQGHEVDVLALARDGQTGEAWIDSVHLYRITKRDFQETTALSYLTRLTQFFIKSFWVCSRLHLKRRYDLIHYHNVPDFGVFCTLLPKLMGCPVILDIHDLVPEFYMRKFDAREPQPVIRILKWVEKLACRYADHVITVTDIWRERLIIRSVSDKKCTVIMNAPFQKLFHPLPKRHQNRNTFEFMYHGNIIETTGVEVAVNAAAKAIHRVPNLRLNIVGEGRSRKKVEALIDALDLAGSVHLRKSEPIENIPAIIADADAGLDTKLDGVYSGETLSVKAMEYLAMEKPTIVSGTAAARHYFDDGMVLFFEPGNADELALQMIEVALSPSRRKKLVEGAKRFNRKYSFESLQQVYFQLIDDLCR